MYSITNLNVIWTTQFVHIVYNVEYQTTNLFKEVAPVMITSNHPKSTYKNNGLFNGARGFIDSIQASADDPDVAQVVWVLFTDDKICQLLKMDST